MLGRRHHNLLKNLKSLSSFLVGRWFLIVHEGIFVLSVRAFLWSTKPSVCAKNLWPYKFFNCWTLVNCLCRHTCIVCAGIIVVCKAPIVLKYILSIWVPFFCPTFSGNAYSSTGNIPAWLWGCAEKLNRHETNTALTACSTKKELLPQYALDQQRQF